MGKKFVALFLILMTLTGLSGFYVVDGLQAYSRYQQSTLANQEHCGGQPPVHICVRNPSAIFSAFYPSYVATQLALFTITYSSSNPLTLIISGNINGFSQVYTQTVSATSTTQALHFTPPLFNSVLRKFTSNQNTSLHVQVTDTKSHLYYLNDSHLLLYSRELMQWEKANRLQIAAWVTPNDPAIATLVTKATTHLQRGMNAMIGYYKATPQSVRDQVNAIYDALLFDYHFHYIQESVPYGGPGDTNGNLQNVKLPAEILQQRQGMCVELTVLLASAVESIGLDAEIVIIPEHAFLGVALSHGSQRYEYWDAVQINNNVAGDSDNLYTDTMYAMNVKQHTILDTIVISEARNAGITAMV